jgi:hypothetical protein
VPLVLRGPVVRWLVYESTHDRCGTFAVGGGRIGWSTLWRMALGRPFSVELDDVRIVAPDGQVLLAARRIEAQALVHRRPLGVELANAVVAGGTWRLSFLPGGNFADAFRTVPPQGRAACMRAAAPEPAPPVHETPSFVLRHVDIDDIDMDLDFPDWRLEFGHVRTEGELALPAGMPLTFEVRHATASATRLRVGPEGAAGTLSVPFDAVTIVRVAAPRASPTDLVIELAHASTGKAVLSGRAVFSRLFAASPPASEPRLELSARWTSVASALAASTARWLPDRATLDHLDGDITVESHAPLSNLDADAELVAKDFRLRLSGRGSQVTAHALAYGFDDSWLIEPALRSALGGRISGHLLATAHLASRFAEVEARVEESEFTLARKSTAFGPERVRLRVGAAGHPSDDETLSLDIASAELAASTVRVRGVQLSDRGFSLLGHATLTVAPDSASRSHLDAAVAIDVPAITTAFPQSLVGGALHVTGNLSGTARRMDLSLRFARSTVVHLGGQRVSLPRRVRAIWTPGDTLAVAPFRLGLGQGEATWGGQVQANGNLAGTLAIRELPLAPWFALLHAPSWPTISDGNLSLRLALSGTWSRLTLAGSSSIDAMSLRDWKPLATAGALRIVLSHGRPTRATAAMQLRGPGLEDATLKASLDGDVLRVDAGGDIETASLASLWPAAIRGVKGRVRARVSADVVPGSAPRVSAHLHALESVSVELAALAAPLEVASDAAIDFSDHVLQTPRLQVSWQSLDATVTGQLRLIPSALLSSQADLTVTATLDVRRGPLRLPWATLDRGKAALTAEIAGTLATARLRSRIDLDDLGVVSGPAPPARLNGAIAVEDNVAHTTSLTIDVSRVGRLHLGSDEAPAQLTLISFFPLRLGSMDVPIRSDRLSIAEPALPLRLPLLRLDARLRGDARTALLLSGDVDFEHASYNAHRSWSSSPSSAPPWYRALPSTMTIDLTLRGLHDGMNVDVPVLPDIALDFRCHLRATHEGARLTGEVRGQGWYARTALRLYDWWSARDVERCQLLEP